MPPAVLDGTVFRPEAFPALPGAGLHRLVRAVVGMATERASWRDGIATVAGLLRYRYRSITPRTAPPSRPGPAPPVLTHRNPRGLPGVNAHRSQLAVARTRKVRPERLRGGWGGE